MSDEQFPLLLVLVGDKEVSKNNKRIKGRFDGITSGASAIITEWPNYLSSCWLTALICGIALFTVSILLTSCLTFQQNQRLPRCSSDVQLFNNNTIHLVHSSQKWYKRQLDLLQHIIEKFPNYQIRILIITNRKKINDTNNNVTDQVFSDFLNHHPEVQIELTDFSKLFESSPLFLNWVSLNYHMRIFAARVLQLWEFGGISFDLLEYKLSRKFQNLSCLNEMKLREFIDNGYQRFKNLPSNMVSVDLNGLHMECKTPCHAFFGNILKKLNNGFESSKPREVLFGPMYSFCRLRVIDKEFCQIRHLYFK